MRQSQQLVIIIIIELKEAAAGKGHTDPSAACRESAESFRIMSPSYATSGALDSGGGATHTATNGSLQGENKILTLSQETTD